MDKKQYKKLKREEILRRRDALPAGYCRCADTQIFRRICSLREYEEADTVFCYVSTDKEVCTYPIIEHALKRGKHVAVPKCTGYGMMDLLAITSFEDLSPGKYGIFEPRENLRPVSSTEIQFSVIPCLTCDMDGWRLGYGAGYYDRYLTGTDFIKAVVCRDQMMSESVYHELFDQQMDIVVTEKIVKYIR